MAFISPTPCSPSGGGGPDFDNEPVVLCDILPDGTVAGSAIAVYEFDGTTGMPVGSPTFVIPGTNTPYIAVGILQPCDEPCLKCDTAVLCDNTSTPASEIVASTIKMLDTPNVAGNDGWNVTAFNTANAVNTPQVCPGVSGPPLPVPYPAFYNADWCAAWLAGCPGGTAAGGGCALNPGPALGLTSDFESINCGTGSGFSDSCSRYLVEKTFNTDAACTRIRVTSQRFRADGSAKVMIDGQDTGIFGAYNMTSPDGTIILTVAPGSHTMTIDLRDSEAPTWIQGGLTIECLAITPAATTSVQFLRTTCRTCIGDILSVTDTTLDGQTPYVPGTNVTICDPGAGNIPQPCANCESFVLADRITNLQGQAGCISFLRRVCHNCDGTVSSITDTLLDGTSPYTPTGNIGLGCDFPEDEEVLCDAGALYKPFLRTYVKDTGSAVVGTKDSDLNGIPYTVVGPVVTCIGSTETQLVCDGASSTSLVAVYHFDSGGILLSTLYYGIDGSGPYAPAGPLYEGGCCQPVDIGPVCYDVLGDIRTAVGQRRCRTDNPVLFDTFWYDSETGVFLGGTVDITIVDCPANSFDFEEEILCDNNGPFIRRYTYVDGVVSATTNFNLAGAVYVPVGTVVICPTNVTITPEFDVEIVTLCDDNGGFFRRFTYDENTGLPTTVVTTDFSGNPYVTVGTVKVCDQTVTVTEVDAEIQFMCDSNGPTTFLRRYLFNETTGAFTSFVDMTLAGAVYVPVGTVTAGACTTVGCVHVIELIGRCDYTGAPGALGFNSFFERLTWDCNGVLVSADTITSTGTPYVPTGTVKTGLCDPEIQQEILCDSNGTQFLRRYSWTDRQVGVNNVPLVRFDDFALDGVTAFAPVGAVGLCPVTVVPTTELDVEFHLLCDSTGTTFLRAYRYNETTGAFTNFVDQNFDGTAFVPVGAVGECSGCCVVSQVCLSNGHPGVVLRFQDGTFHNFDTITGLAFVGTDIIPCTQGEQVTQNETSTIARQTGAGAIAIPANRRSVTMVTISGNPTVSISGGAAVATAAGVTLTWSVDSRNQLLADTFTFTGVVGSDFIVITTF